MQDATLTLHKVLNILVYGSLFCVVICTSYKLSKMVRLLMVKLISSFGVVLFL